MKNLPIKYTDDKELFLTERWAEKANFGYVIPLEKEGDYVLITQHAEHSFSKSGERVWNLQLGATVVQEHIDIHKRVGAHSATNLYTPFTFKNQ